jgi:hypothetical protein
LNGTKSTLFWDITPCILLKVIRRFGGTYRLYLQGRTISRARNQRESRWQAERASRLRCSAYSSTLKMEAICSSETSIDFQRTARRYIPEDSTLRVRTSNPTLKGTSSLAETEKTYKGPMNNAAEFRTEHLSSISLQLHCYISVLNKTKLMIKSCYLMTLF